MSDCYADSSTDQPDHIHQNIKTPGSP
jgi:hypothetical protein